MLAMAVPKKRTSDDVDPDCGDYRQGHERLLKLAKNSINDFNGRNISGEGANKLQRPYDASMMFADQSTGNDSPHKNKRERPNEKDFELNVHYIFQDFIKNMKLLLEQWNVSFSESVMFEQYCTERLDKLSKEALESENIIGSQREQIQERLGSLTATLPPYKKSTVTSSANQ